MRRALYSPSRTPVKAKKITPVMQATCIGKKIVEGRVQTWCPGTSTSLTHSLLLVPEHKFGLNRFSSAPAVCAFSQVVEVSTPNPSSISP